MNAATVFEALKNGGRVLTNRYTGYPPQTYLEYDNGERIRIQYSALKPLKNREGIVRWLGYSLYARYEVYGIAPIKRNHE